MRPSPTPRAACATLLLLAPACASYTQRTGAALAAYQQGRFEAAMVAYAEDADGFLRGAEAGMVALTAGRWEEARVHLSAAAEAVREVEDRALVSPDNAGEALLSWFLNEGVKAYDGEGYERVMLHATLGMAYLALGSVEDLVVEVRRANSLLETEEELYQRQYAAGGLGHFISAVGYELRGEPADAYIDYKRMEAKGLGGALVGRSLVRLATQLAREDELEGWVKRWGPDVPRPEGAAAVVLIAGVGLGPYKEEGKLTIPTGDGILTWAVPVMRRRPQPLGHLVLESPSAETSVQTVVVEDVGRVATENLDDRMAWLAAKSTVRTVLKRELRQELERKHGVMGAIAGDLFNFFTERADLRAWLTLPDTWQAARLFLEPGPCDLALSAPGGGRIQLGTYELEPGETMFVLARTLGRTLYAHPVGGRPVPPADEIPPTPEENP